jgi:hypothetical protein
MERSHIPEELRQMLTTSNLMPAAMRKDRFAKA